MSKPDKKIKALISSIIIGNKEKAKQIAKDLSISIVEEKEQFIFESIFGRKKSGESDV